MKTFEDKVRELAYLKWEKAGRPPCDGVQFWLEAENELDKQTTNHCGANACGERKVAAKRTPKKS